MGPLSAPPPRQILAAGGYTLLELLVVMFVLGILASIAALNMHAHNDAALQTDAKRLADLFTLAADEAQIRSRTITWQADASGYRFWVAGERGPMPLEDEHFRARAWSDPPTEVTLTTGTFVADVSDRGIQIPFAIDGVQPAFTLQLQAHEATRAVTADGIGHYRVAERPE